jgi:NADPH2:quinone reductase
MQAILAREFGGPEVLKLEDLPDPVAGPGQIRVRLHAIGVNPYETYMRAGVYAIKPDLPYTPGADAAGVIDQVGSGVAEWKTGQRVYISGTVQGKAQGAYAQYAVCLPEQLHRLPDRISFAQGAAYAFNHKHASYLDEITKATDGRGPDVILEMLANVNLDHDLTVVAPSGRIVVIGNRGRVEIDARKIMMKDVQVFGFALWGIPPEEIKRAHIAIIAGLESGALNPVVGTEMPLSDAGKAHAQVMEPGARGKIVLVP